MLKVLARILLAAAAVVLFGVAGLHLSGLPIAQEFARGEEGPAFLRQTIEVLWTLPSFHWIAFALAAGWSCVRLPQTLDHRALLLIVAIALMVDGAMVYVALGGFIGAFAAVGAGVAIGLGALIAPSRS